jgi:hypothetical protein
MVSDMLCMLDDDDDDGMHACMMISFLENGTYPVDIYQIIKNIKPLNQHPHALTHALYQEVFGDLQSKGKESNLRYLGSSRQEKK